MLVVSAICFNLIIWVTLL